MLLNSPKISEFMSENSYGYLYNKDLRYSKAALGALLKVKKRVVFFVLYTDWYVFL